MGHTPLYYLRSWGLVMGHTPLYYLRMWGLVMGQTPLYYLHTRGLVMDQTQLYYLYRGWGVVGGYGSDTMQYTTDVHFGVIGKLQAN